MTNDRVNLTFGEEIDSMPLENILNTRLWMYQFLSRNFYCKPSFEDLLDYTVNNIFRQLINLESDKINVGFSLLADIIDEMPRWSKQDWEVLGQDYQRLFVGPGSMPAPPWESVYLSKERIILDEHTLLVREFYRSWGCEVIGLNKNPDDHIGLELEFIARLTQQAIGHCQSGNHEALRKVLEAQHCFLKNHPLLWVDQFCSKLAENTEQPLYKGMALVTPCYLQMDAELLENIVSILT